MSNLWSNILKGKTIIVGSSGKMLRYDKGKEIDSYNNIVRINFSEVLIFCKKFTEKSK